MSEHPWVVVDPYVPPGQFFGIPATIGHDMNDAPWKGNESIRDELPGVANARHNGDPHDRALAGYDARIRALADAADAALRRDTKLAERIARLERKDVLAGADAAKGRRLLGSLLVLLGRRLRDEGDQ